MKYNVIGNYVIIGMFIMIRYKYNCCLDLYVFIGYFGDLVNVLCWFLWGISQYSMWLFKMFVYLVFFKKKCMCLYLYYVVGLVN